MPYTRPVHGRAVYTARTRPCMGRAHGQSTPPVYMTVYGPSARTSSAVYMERTRPVHVHDTYTAAYTCLRVHGRVTRPCAGHLHGRKRPSTRPCNVVYTAVYGPYRLMYTAVYGPCARPFSAVYTGRVHCRFRPSTQRIHGRVTARVLGRYTAVYKGRLGRVYGRWAYRAVYTFPDGTLLPCAARVRVTAVYTAHGRNVPSRPVYMAV